MNKLTSCIGYDHEKRQISKHEGSMISSNYGQSLNCSKFSLGTTEKSMIYSKANASSRSFSIKRKRSWHFFDTLRLLRELKKDLGISVFMCTDRKLAETD